MRRIIRVGFATALAVSFAVCACGGDSATNEEEGGVLGPDGIRGICCELGEPSCDCPQAGGWARSVDSCLRGPCDAAPTAFMLSEDEYGCPIWIVGGESCFSGFGGTSSGGTGGAGGSATAGAGGADESGGQGGAE